MKNNLYPIDAWKQKIFTVELEISRRKQYLSNIQWKHEITNSFVINEGQEESGLIPITPYMRPQSNILYRSFSDIGEAWNHFIM